MEGQSIRQRDSAGAHVVGSQECFVVSSGFVFMNPCFKTGYSRFSYNGRVYIKTKQQKQNGIQVQVTISLTMCDSLGVRNPGP